MLKFNNIIRVNINQCLIFIKSILFLKYFIELIKILIIKEIL